MSYQANQVWTGSPVNPQKTQAYVYPADRLNRQSVTENGVAANYVTNALNQITQWTGQTIGYDGNFNFASIGGWLYGYDSENHLTSLGNPGPRAAFVYDGLGRCVKRTIDGVTTMITYDGWKPILEFDGAGNPQVWNVYGPGPDEILLRITNSALVRYHSDRQGNVAFILDANGYGSERYTYDAFGKPAITDWNGNVRTSSAIGNRFMFQGREYFREIGLYDYRHRFYDPYIGRFIQTDPMGLQTEGEKLSAGQKALFSPGGSAPEAFSSSEMNLFRYCGDDPADKSDPLGLASLITDQTNGVTIFDPSPQEKSPISIFPSRSEIVAESFPGAGDPYFSKNIYVTKGPHNGDPISYGPNDIIETDDTARGRWIHGGGKGLDNPLADRQGWMPTHGCTRLQNQDIKALTARIQKFKDDHPKVKVPYDRSRGDDYRPFLTTTPKERQA